MKRNRVFLLIILLFSSLMLLSCNKELNNIQVKPGSLFVEQNGGTFDIEVNSNCFWTMDINYKDMILGYIESDKLSGKGNATIHITIAPNSSANIRNANLDFYTQGSSVAPQSSVSVTQKGISEKIPVETISLDKTEISLTIGEETSLSVSVLPDNATDKDVTWTSDRNDIATVSSKGTVKAIAEGNAIITVKNLDETRSAKCSVTVKCPIVSVTGVSIDKTELEMTNEDAPIKLIATISPDDATNKSVTWNSSDEGVAKVSSDGEITPLSVGTSTITVSSVDGLKTATCIVTVIPFVLPSGALPGRFTVNASGKKVHFSQGNLYYNGKEFKFESNQYDVQNSFNISHISHFFWSKTAAIACAESYSGSGSNMSDVFFTNTKELTANSDFIVNGEKGKFRTLSNEEWQYLFSGRRINDERLCESLMSGITIEGVSFKGIVLFPDNFTEQDSWKTKYTTWEALNNAGLVFLPASGYRNGTSIRYFENGYYWSSSAHSQLHARHIAFTSGWIVVDGNNYTDRDFGHNVRLVTE